MIDMIELKFQGQSYAEIEAAVREFLDPAGNEKTQVINMAQYAPRDNVLPFPAQATSPAPAVQPAALAPLPVQPATPVPPAYAPVQPAAPVPTAAPQYTRDDLMNAGAKLMTTVGMPAMQQLLARFGVPAIHQLPPERYGEFAQALRDMGGAI